MNIRQRAHLGLPLFPGERAAIRAGKQIIQVGAAAVFGQLAPIESLVGQAKWGEALHLVVVIFLAAAFAWLDKYYSAQRDSVLSSAPANDPKTPAPAPDSVPVPSA